MRFHVNILSIIIIDDAHRFRESRVQKRPEMKLQRPEVLTQPPHFDGLSGRGKRAPPALGPGSTWRRRSQDVGAALSTERRRRWLTVSGKNGKNGRRCVLAAVKRGKEKLESIH
jgi:hypothetical protein